MRKQIRLSGSGGQGVITAAIIYAEAAVSAGMEAVQSQSYDLPVHNVEEKNRQCFWPN